MQSHSTASDTHPRIENINELDTIETLTKANPNLFTDAQLRWALRFRDENGLSQAVIKVGRRLYIHRPSFLKWLANQH